jgi:hypothetical protein
VERDGAGGQRVLHLVDVAEQHAWPGSSSVIRLR